MGYQERDKHIVDYEMYELPGVAPYPGGGRFRGPQIKGKEYIACLGAAQTFGCLVKEPFPFILSKSLGIETLNLGYGGAGPTFFSSNTKLLEWINGSRLVVLQVLSARSQSNSMFRTTHYAMEGTRLSDGKQVTAEDFFTDLILNRPEIVPEIVAETRRNYVSDMINLLEMIERPKVLFWFSVRDPEYEGIISLPIWKFWGDFPHFVDSKMLEQLKPYADEFVSCVSNEGLPQILVDMDGRETTISHSYSIANPVTYTDTQNNYYPSPQMHLRAAESLLEACWRLID